MVHLTVCSYHVTYTFYSECTLCRWLIVKDLFDQNRCDHGSAECRCTLKHVCDMIRTHSQMHHADKYSQNNSFIWLVLLNACGFQFHHSYLNLRYRSSWKQRSSLTFRQLRNIDSLLNAYMTWWKLNSWVFVYNLNGCGFESRWSHLNFRCRVCFEQEVLWHSSNYIV